jgi:hypothetical protein
MKWLDDKNSVSQEELEKNRRDAADYAAYAADAAYYAGHWVNKYFKESGEDKEEYLKELNK